ARVDQHRADPFVEPEPVADRDVEARPAAAGENEPFWGAHEGAGWEEQGHGTASRAKVRASPSSKQTLASKPSAARAADTSSVGVRASGRSRWGGRGGWGAPGHSRAAASIARAAPSASGQGTLRQRTATPAFAAACSTTIRNFTASPAMLNTRPAS